MIGSGLARVPAEARALKLSCPSEVELRKSTFALRRETSLESLAASSRYAEIIEKGMTGYAAASRSVLVKGGTREGDHVAKKGFVADPDCRLVNRTRRRVNLDRSLIVRNLPWRDRLSAV